MSKASLRKWPVTLIPHDRGSRYPLPAATRILPIGKLEATVLSFCALLFLSVGRRYKTYSDRDLVSPINPPTPTLFSLPSYA